MPSTETQKSKTLTRNPNLDLIRAVAVFFVPCVHYFQYNGYYAKLELGEATLPQSVIVEMFMVCVPLFVLLTGYLCCEKPLNREYFHRIRPILTTYFLACIGTLVFRVVLLHERITLFQALLLMLQPADGAIGYAWYISMYVGLFLLIPFLNILYHNLQDKGQKQLLIAILLLLTTAPSLLNIYDWLTPGFWREPAMAQRLYMLVPDWWTGIWPISYYFLGAYIREYDIKLKKGWNLLLLAAWIVLCGCFNSYRRLSSDWGDFQNVGSSVLLFLLLLHLDISRMPGAVRWMIRRISQLSLGIYLCSYLSDFIVYYGLDWIVPYISVPLSFLIATALAQCVSWGQTLLEKGIGQLKK